ncbi:MAG: hypothetical protein LQ337_007031 [Flavoplaca oasis]|nr:MAG: hypothetical protein LQ337_007031 [Flavoplaca oasis]
MDTMDPSIWRNLPLEVLCTVVESCDCATLINWSCTSEFFYNLGSDVLWETLRINGKEISYFDFVSWKHKMTGKSVKDSKREGGMLLYLLTKDGIHQRPNCQGVDFPYIQGQTAKLPASRVKELYIDFDGHRVLMHKFMNAQIVGKLLGQMPQLKRCLVDGELKIETWGHLMRAASIRSLGIRTSTEYVRTPPASSQSASREWALAQILNFQHLAGFIQLNSLSIGRLTNREARGLAQALVSLTNLSELSISAGALAQSSNDVRWLYGAGTRTPIFELLASLLELSVQQVGESSLSSGYIQLARSLKKLTLRDFYHSGNRWSDDEDYLLLETIQHCKNLTSLEIGLLQTTALQDFFSRAEFPALQHFAVLGCHHSFTERDWANMAGIELLQAEHHASDDFASWLDYFLYRHRNSLSSVILNRPVWQDKRRKGEELRFSKSVFSRLWSPEGPPIGIGNGNWQHGGWNFCSKSWTTACCIERRFGVRQTLSSLEERDRRMEEIERAAKVDVSDGERDL